MSNQHLFLPSTFLKAPAGLGIGRFVCQLQRITLKFCKTYGASRGVRNYLENDLLDFARHNPGVVVYVKPRRHRSPVIVAEYLNGQRHWLNVHEYTRTDIVKCMGLLLGQHENKEHLRLRKPWATRFPSIQGPWTPFMDTDPEINITEFPNMKLSDAHREYSATDEVLRLFKEQQEAEKQEQAQEQAQEHVA